MTRGERGLAPLGAWLLAATTSGVLECPTFPERFTRRPAEPGRALPERGRADADDVADAGRAYGPPGLGEGAASGLSVPAFALASWMSLWM